MGSNDGYGSGRKSMVPDDGTLDVLLARFEASPLPELVERDVRLLASRGKADVLIGMRRSGKTYAMYGRMRELLAEGVPRSRMLYLNLEDERLGDPDLTMLDRVLELFYRRDPGGPGRAVVPVPRRDPRGSAGGSDSSGACSTPRRRSCVSPARPRAC
jgi:hypothetical protein